MRFVQWKELSFFQNNEWKRCRNKYRIKHKIEIIWSICIWYMREYMCAHNSTHGVPLSAFWLTHKFYLLMSSWEILFNLVSNVLFDLKRKFINESLQKLYTNSLWGLLCNWIRLSCGMNNSILHVTKNVNDMSSLWQHRFPI